MEAQTGRIVMQNGRLASFSVPVSVLRQDATDRSGARVPMYVADCPMLRVASHGMTQPEALRSFEELVRTYLEELIELGRLDDVLAEKGWRKSDAAPPEGSVAWLLPAESGVVQVALA